MKKTVFLTASITIFACILSLYLYRLMPARMATHWGISGEVNGYSPRILGVSIIPAVMIIMLGLYFIAPVIDPKRKNIEQFREVFDRFILVLFMFFEYLHLVVLAWNLGYRFDFLRAILPTFSVILYATGDLVTDAKPNWTIGIRLPWTLANETVWNKTNKFAGKLFKYSSALALATLFLPQYGIYLIVAPAIATAVLTGVYSYLLFRKREAKKK